MKKIHYSILALFVMFLITSNTVKKVESQRLFEKIVFIEVSVSEDSVLFQPLSKAWDKQWHLSSDISIYGSPVMNYDKYKFSFNNRIDNLWTILHPLIIDGTIQSYYPYDPENYGLGIGDEGELLYPIMDHTENETFLTSEKARENLCEVLGLFGPISDVPLVDEWGDNIIVDLEDGSQSFKYDSPDFIWYKDKDIIKYKLRVSILFNKNGKEKKRIIKSICPVVNRMADIGIVGEKELVWLDFDELEPYLKKAYYFDENWKPEFYLNYFLQKIKFADIKASR
jgi:hypothetical protein